MDPADRDSLPARRRACDRALLRALAARAAFPRDPWPAWPGDGRRGPPPPLAEILLAISPAGMSRDPDAGNRGLLAALAARGQHACETADAKAQLHSADVHAALAAGDREHVALLLADLAAELRTLEFIRADAAEAAPNLDPDLVLFLWREYVLPWTRQVELAHLLEP